MDKINAILQVGFREIFAIPVIHAPVKWDKKNRCYAPELYL